MRETMCVSACVRLRVNVHRCVRLCDSVYCQPKLEKNPLLLDAPGWAERTPNNPNNPNNPKNPNNPNNPNNPKNPNNPITLIILITLRTLITL